jgi:aryl-alcohol dehydrogenase-like predicted oxidoreductase
LNNVINTEDRTPAQTALKFVLSQPSISTVIPGMKSTDQVEENLRTVNQKPLTEEEQKQIIQYLMHK